MKNLEGKVAFITGGASGIGLGMARTFTKAGMKVVIADIRQDHLDEALSCFDDCRDQVHGFVLDVTDRQAMEDAARETERVFGKVHLLCNNAGINLFGPMEQATYEDWDWVLGVNLGGVINGVKTFLPRLRSHGEGGHIVNTSSMQGIFMAGGIGVYATSKYAVVGLSEALRLDLENDNIGVSVLCPGFVNSKIYDCYSVRPETLSNTGYQIDKTQMDRLKMVHDDIGMDPMVVGGKVMAAIQRNDLYIITHPEFKEDIRNRCEALLAAVPDEEPDPRRLAIEQARPKLTY